VAATVNRSLYCPDGIDVAKMNAYAEDKALGGEIVALHNHAKNVTCKNGCYLLTRTITRTPYVALD
jgi:hypothetical protein